MALMPKRVKHRKSQRGRIKGNATRGNKVVFGDYGLQASQGGWLKAQTIEAGRIAAQQYVRGEGRLYVRVFPDKSVTSTPLETRMGKGKGAPEFWVAVVKPGRVMFELEGLPPADRCAVRAELRARWAGEVASGDRWDIGLSRAERTIRNTRWHGADGCARPSSLGGISR